MTYVELLWTALAVLGVYLAILNGWESYLDLHALGAKQNGRRTIATGNLRREIVRGLISLSWVSIGLLALATPDNPISPIAIVLVLTSAGMVVNSWLDRRDRLYLLEYGMQPRDDKGRFT